METDIKFYVDIDTDTDIENDYDSDNEIEQLDFLTTLFKLLSASITLISEFTKSIQVAESEDEI